MTRVAILGCGAAARRLHVPGLRAAGLEPAVFWSRTRASAEALADESGGAVADAIADALAGSDAVVVATPNVMHAELAIAAARAGLPVLVEKPMATSVADADAMIAAAREAGTVLMVAQTARFAPPVAAMREALASGRLGTLRSVRATLRNTGPLAWSPGASWFTDPALAGGGALMDLGVHLADAIRAITGREAARVAAMTRPAPPIDLDAHAVVTLDDGSMCSINAGWDSPVADFSLTVSGDEAIAHADDRTAPVLVRPDAAPEPLPVPDGDDVWAAFARAIAGEGEPVPSGADGRAALAIVEAAYRSIESGAPVPVGA